MIEALIVLSLPLTFMPMMTGYYAHNHGRSFWRWFALGLGLPFFSLFVIAAVVHRDQRRARATPGTGRPAEQPVPLTASESHCLLASLSSNEVNQLV